MTSWQLARTIVDELAGAGVHHVVLCPGSRNAPLSMALAECISIQLHTRTDERAAGFFALGLAKAGGAAAVVTTSGTAVGNLLPAVMEAAHSGVPLIVVSADRPSYLVGSGANQTTQQRNLFAEHVVASLSLASASAHPGTAQWRSGLRRILTAALGVRTRRPGPVQINAEFDEPLLPDESPLDGQLPLTVAASRPAVPVHLSGSPRTVVLVGDAPPAVGAAARRLAEDAGLPLLAEPSSNARAGRCAIAGYRLVLPRLAPDIQRAVMFGHPTLSRPVSALLARPDVELVVVTDRADWSDPGLQARLVADAVEVEAGDPAWLDRWQRADAELAPTETPLDHLTGPVLAAQVWDSVRPDANLVIGSSNPIRDLDVAPITSWTPMVYANRGLAGIDGLLSTAQGIAVASGRPTTLLVGDLSFLHDVGSLARPLGNVEPDLRVVVADDNGGSLFRELEVGRVEYSDNFERLFGMPHGLDLTRIAAGFGVPAEQVVDPQEAARILAEPVHGLSVLVARLAARD